MRIFFKGYVVSLTLYVLLIIYIGLNYDFIVFPAIGWIEMLSLVIFFATFLLASKTVQWYYIMLIFNFLAMPASIDNFLPSVNISSPIDYKTTVFPILTHIDFFLIFGIIKYTYLRGRMPYMSKYIMLLFILIAASIFYNCTSRSDLEEIIIILSNSYHLRYFILVVLLVLGLRERPDKNTILKGLILTISFLVVEATIYSFIYQDYDKLISGTLRNNTFANILAAIAIYFLILTYKRLVSRIYLLVPILVFIIIILTKCRSAVLLFLIFSVIVFLCWLFELYKQRNFRRLTFALLTFLISMFGIFKLANTSDRFSFSNLKIQSVDFSQKALPEIIQFQPNSFTESLTLRLNHYQTSVNMINAEPIFGIGSGLWNRNKMIYGSKDRNIMDAHNDVLALASQYGIPAALGIVLFIFIFPFISFLNQKKQKSVLDYILIINVVMMIAGLTNAALFKHQTFGFLIFLSVISFIGPSSNDLALRKSEQV